MKSDLKPNQRVTTFFSLESMQLKKSKGQKYFLVLGLHDKTGSVTGYLWNNPQQMASELREKTFVKVLGTTKVINSSLCVDVEKIRIASKEEVDIRDYVEVVPGGVELWHKKLLDEVGLISNPDCRRLIDSFLKDEAFMELFLTSPGGVSVHHNYIGGLLEHTVSVMKQAAAYANMHPLLLNKDVLLTGAFLHDLGKTEELYWEVAREYTNEGKLLGHISIGLMLLNRKIASLANFPSDLALHLRHLVLSHHGNLEFGSPVRPATPEALTLHLIDNQDAKLNHLYCFLQNVTPGPAWSPYDKILGTELYLRGPRWGQNKDVLQAKAA